MKKPLRPVRRVSVQEEEVFRNSEPHRKELEEVLNSEIFQTALHILYQKRIVVERATESLALGADAVVSVRMNSQRVGIEGFLAGLKELTQPLPEPIQQEKPAVFGAEAAAAELLKLGVSI